MTTPKINRVSNARTLPCGSPNGGLTGLSESVICDIYFQSNNFEDIVLESFYYSFRNPKLLGNFDRAITLKN
jgi:hypothetical protein